MYETIDSINFAFDEEFVAQYELPRFLSIVNELGELTGNQRDAKQRVILEYLLFSPNSDNLVSEFIMACLGMKSPNRLELAIDTLSKTGGRIIEFTKRYLDQDISRWSKLNPRKKYQPNDDFWYVLLRSVGKCGVQPDAALRLISACQDEMSVGLGEAVVESLGDLRTLPAMKLLDHIAHSDSNNFVRKMALDVLADIADDNA